MTVKELIERLDTLGLTGDEPLAVSAVGVVGAGKSVTDVARGIDWDHGKVLLHTNPPLAVYAKPSETELGELRRLVAELRSLVEIAPVKTAKWKESWFARRERALAESTYDRMQELRRGKERAE